MIGPDRRAWIRNIEFYLISGFRYASKVMKTEDVYKLAFDVLADCSILRKLYIGVSEQTTDGLPRKKEQDLFAVREWGVFDAVRGLGDAGPLDVKVREVGHWATYFDSLDEDNDFNIDIKESRLWKRNLLFFQHKHVLEFERALAEDFRRPKEVEYDDTDDDEEEEDEDIDVDDSDEDDMSEVKAKTIVKWVKGSQKSVKRKRTATKPVAPRKRLLRTRS